MKGFKGTKGIIIFLILIFMLVGYYFYLSNRGNGNGEEGTVLLQETELAKQVWARLVRRQNGAIYRIDGDRVMIGSGEAADIRIENNHAISRSHVWIWRINGEYFVEDNQSKNGTFINGVRLQPKLKEAVCAGTILRLANEDFEFRMD